MHPVIEALLHTAPVLTDGAWGTQMQQRGLPIGAPPDPWNLDWPDRVQEVAAAYVAAGAQIILTNTFGASSVLLDRHALADRAVEINRAGAAISRAAAGNRAKVFGSIGPTGKLPSVGDIDADLLYAAFSQQAAALAEGGVDGFVIETMCDLAEAVAAVRAAHRIGLPIVACLTYGAGQAGARTVMGTTPEQAAMALHEAGADIVGANCGQGPADMAMVIERLHAASGRPVWAKANAGLPRIVDGVAVYDVTPETFAAAMAQLPAVGAGFLGGCCGTAPEFIQRLAERIVKGEH